MKKIILLAFALTALGVSAQKYSATVYFADGTVKQGNADAIANGVKKINFKEDNASKSEKIETINLKKIEYYDSKTQKSIVFERLNYIYNYKKRGGDTPYSIPVIAPVWMQKIDQLGDIVVYSVTSSSSGYYNIGTGNMFTPTTTKTWAFQYKDETPMKIFWLIDGYPLGVKYQNFWVAKFFDKLCPQLVKDHLSKQLKLEKDPLPLIEYYNTNCGTVSK